MVKNLEIIQVAIEQLGKENPEMIRSMLVSFLASNCKEYKPKKIDIWDFVATGENAEKRPVTSGVFMDSVDKVAVATDGHAMFISKLEYEPIRGKKKIVLKDGSLIDGGYVNYKSPLNDKFKPIKLFDKEAIQKSAKITMAEFILNGDTGSPGIPISSEADSNLLFPIRWIPTLLEIGFEGWQYNGKGAYYHKDSNEQILIMSVLR